MFDHRNSLIHIVRSSTASCYVTPVLEPAALSLFQSAPKTVFPQDNSRLKVARRTLNILTEFHIHIWTAASPDLNPIENLRNLIGRDVNQESLTQTMDELHTEVDASWQ